MANKISLNASSKTEMLVFRDPRRKIDFDSKMKIDGKKNIKIRDILGYLPRQSPFVASTRGIYAHFNF